MPEETKIRSIKFAPPPPELPIYGRMDPTEGSFIGRTNYVAALEDKRFIFGLKRKDRKRHVYMIGKSGVGKSKLLELLMRQDVANGHGLCLIEPHGDLAAALLDFIPEHRVNDVIIIDPSSVDHPLVWNPLAGVHLSFRHQLAKGFIEVLEAQLGSAWDSRMEYLFRFVMLALLDYPDATLPGTVRMLTDKAYREKTVEHIHDEAIKRFWTSEFAEWVRGEGIEAEVIAPLVNRLEEFFSDPLLKTILSQKENKINLTQLMQEQKIILINLCKGNLGKANSSFLGNIFITKIKEAGMERARLEEKEGKDFYMYIDEFQQFVSETLEHLMFEAKKYRFAITISHQYLGQIISHFRASIFANVGTIIVFRVGGEDAEKLESEMAPTFKARDMINLGMKEFYIKMIIDGEAHDPFSAETLKVLPAAHSSLKRRIVEVSQQKYNR